MDAEVKVAGQRLLRLDNAAEACRRRGMGPPSFYE